MLVSELQVNLALALRDVGMEQVAAVQILRFINQSSRDAGNQDWLYPAEEDESVTLATGTYYYAVPAGFSFINQLRSESAAPLFPTRIPDNNWRLVFNGGVAQIYFEPRLFTIPNGKKIKVVGQKRPTIYVLGTETVDVGIESFLHERASMYGARFLARRGGEHTSFYDTLAQTSWATSEQMIQHQRERFVKTNYGRPVPRG